MVDVWLPLFGGLALLIAGGELLVRGAVRVATQLGVSPLVIGLTLVGFGTSTPELVTSAQAVLADAPGIAYGNIVGSNIANILLILGLAALLSPIAIAPAALKRDGLVMIAVAIAFAALAAAMPLGRVAGLAALSALMLYVYLAFRQERVAVPATGEAHSAAYDKSLALQEADPTLAPKRRGQNGLLVSLVIAVGGLALILVGGNFLVDGAVELARGLGVSEAVIGLTIVAVGTSMPELVTSIVAGLKRQGDVALGNVMGSNIYNVLGIGGFTALIAPGEVPAEIVGFDNLVMVAVSLALLLAAWTGQRISRWEGGLLLTGYVGYLWLTWP
ncbi:calcium/sodium antiporter [Acuticoccus sediminis]|uniref:calcium/sodium antiporter n=1 Tax=Acuticoccus sediminis TaxID=2184697 RepID=UPI001CFD0FC7|nr:calcium/sodium antiporter [Acuticoccus sediminis]